MHSRPFILTIPFTSRLRSDPEIPTRSLWRTDLLAATNRAVYQVSISPRWSVYYLALLKLLGLQSDLALHLGMAPWACLLSWSAVCLSLRWTRSYWPAVVTVLSAPVVVGFNLMLDVPVTALCLAGLEWWCRADDRYQHFRTMLDPHGNSSDSANLASISASPSLTSIWFTVLMSALLFSLAVLTKYVAVAVVAAIGLRILFRLQVRLWPIVFVPAFTFIAWQVFCRLEYGASQTEQGLGFLSRFQVDLARTLLERFAVLSVCWVTSWRSCWSCCRSLLSTKGPGKCLGTRRRRDLLCLVLEYSTTPSRVC